VRDLLEPSSGLGLRLVAGAAGLDQVVTLSRVQRPGLALTGYTEYIRYGRVQILGASELGYLRKLSAARRAAVLRRLASCRISCFVVTKGLDAPAELLAEAEARGIPILVTPAESTPFIKALSALLVEETDEVPRHLALRAADERHLGQPLEHAIRDLAGAAEGIELVLVLHQAHVVDERTHVVHALGFLKDHRQARGDAVPVVVLDREGEVGARVYGHFRAHADAHPNDFAVVGIRSSERAIRQPLIYDRLRDELWGNFSQWLREGGAIPEDTKLEKDMHAPKWEMNIRGRQKVTDKKELRKILGRSTDRADAVQLAVWDVNTDELEENETPPAPEREGDSAELLDPYAAADMWRQGSG